jgi:hypothetical protein
LHAHIALLPITPAIHTYFLYDLPQTLVENVAVVARIQLNIHEIPILLTLKTLWSSCSRSSTTYAALLSVLECTLVETPT